MPQAPSTEELITLIAEALHDRSNQTAPLSDARRQQLATQIQHTWLAYAAQTDRAATQTLGTQLAEAGVRSPMLMQLHKLLLQTAHDQADRVYAFVGDLIDGVVAATERSTRQAAINEFRVNQQREDQLRAVIQELSTPIIPIYRGVLVLPLVGAIDSLRAQEITERLLEEIVRQQADMVIIDITGVSVVDTSVANHLIMAAQAVNLLGSNVIFTGISCTIAQTIVQLGVTLGDVTTLSNLQAGMLYALEQLGLGITELEPA